MAINESMTPAEAERFERFKAEWEAACRDPGMGVVIQLDFTTAWAVGSQLQLALRHPKNTGGTADVARDVAITLFTKIAPRGELARVAAMGFDRQYDEPFDDGSDKGD